MAHWSLNGCKSALKCLSERVDHKSSHYALLYLIVRQFWSSRSLFTYPKQMAYVLVFCRSHEARSVQWVRTMYLIDFGTQTRYEQYSPPGVDRSVLYNTQSKQDITSGIDYRGGLRSYIRLKEMASQKHHQDFAPTWRSDIDCKGQVPIQRPRHRSASGLVVEGSSYPKRLVSRI